MKIAVVGANSTLGRRIVIKAEEIGINVVGMVRSADNLVGNGALVLKDYNELEAEDFEGCHVVLDTVSFPHIERYSSELLPVWRLLEIFKNTPQPLLLIGSCAFLYSDESREKIVLDDSCLCCENSQDKNRLRLCVNAYKRLKEVQDVAWSVLCPPLILDQKGYGQGKFEFGNDVVPMGIDGISSITLTDFTSAVIELLLRGFKPHALQSVRATKVLK